MRIFVAIVLGFMALIALADITNTAGQIVSGSGASGSPVSGNPILTAGSDGTNTRTVLTDTSGRPIVVGAAAAGTAITGNPLLMGGSDGTNARSFSVTGSGVLNVLPNASSIAGADGISNTVPHWATAGSASVYSQDYIYLFNGTTHDQARTATVGNNVAATGIAADAPYLQYNTSAPTLTNTNYSALQGDVNGNLKVAPQPASPPTANILVGRQTFSANGGPTTLITVTAGKTFTGTLGASVSCDTVAGTATACQATAAFTTTGAGTTPAAGAVFDCDARSGANAATGTVGSQSANYCYLPINVNCSTGTCTVAITATIAGTAGIVTASASGTQQ